MEQALLCQVCGERSARLRVSEIGPDGVAERLLCLDCGESHTIQPMECLDAKDGDLHFRLFLLPEEMSDGCTRRLEFDRWVQCPKCEGEPKGKSSRDCRACRGRGRLVEHVTLDIQVPAGMTPGERPKILRLRGMGDLRRSEDQRGSVLLHVNPALDLALGPHPTLPNERQAPGSTE